MPYRADGTWYYDPAASQQASNLPQYKSEQLNQLVDIAQRYGIQPKQEEPKMGLLGRVGNALNILNTAPAISAALSGKNPITAQLQHIGKSAESAITGKAYTPTTYSDVLKQAGWTSQSLPDKIARGVIGFTGDVLLDPTTYISFGTTGALKAGGKTLNKAAIPAIKQTAFDLARNKAIVEFGENVADDVIRNIAKTPEITNMARAVWSEGLQKELPEFMQFVDSGGIKFAGKSLVSGDTIKTVVGDAKRAVSDLPLFQTNLGKAAMQTAEKTKATLGKLFDRDYGLSEAFRDTKNKWIDMFNYQKSKDFDNWIDIVKEVSDEDAIKLSYAIEKGQEGISLLPKNLQKKAKEIRSFFDRYKEVGLKEGLLEGSLDNYVTHIYKSTDADSILENLNKFADKKISTAASFMKHRQVDSLEDAVKLGLDPELDIRKIGAGYLDMFNKSLANKKYLEEIGDKFGKKVIQGTEEITRLQDNLSHRPLIDFAKQVLHRDFGVNDFPKADSAIFALFKKKVKEASVESIPQGTLSDLQKIAGLDIKNIPDWGVYEKTISQLSDNVVKDDLAHFYKTFRYQVVPNIFEKGGEWVKDIKSVDKILDNFAEVPFTPKEFARMEKTIGEPLVEYSDKITGKMFLPKSIANELHNNPKLFDDPAVNYLLKGYDKFLSFWKGSVTSLFPAFHVRNSVSNVAQNALDIGIQSINPARHADAISIMLGKDGVLKTALGEEIPYKLVKELAEKNGILRGNFFYTDAARAIEDELASATGKLSKINPLNAGRWVGGNIEDEARLVNFISNIGRGLDPTEAAKRTKKFLFDYNNLSKFERDVLRRLIPFYTFTRKNLSLQAAMLATRPGLISTELKGIKAAGEIIGEPVSEEEKSKNLPSWAAAQAGFKSGTDKYGRPLYVTGLGLPIEAATKIMPKDIASSLSPIVKAPIELISGQDIFRGRPIKEIYKANEAAAIFKVFEDATGMNEDEISDKLGLRSYYQNVYVNGKKTGEKEKVYTWNPTVLYALRTLPTSRLYGTLGFGASEDKTSFEKVMKILTGISTYSFDEEEQQYFREASIEDELKQQLKRYGILGTGEYYYEKDKNIK